MGPVHTERVRFLASQMRRACEELAPTLDDCPEFGYFSEFPTGQCGTVSELLAQYFYDETGWNLATIVRGWIDGNSHAWLEIGTLTVDITADQEQFSGTRPSVMVLEDSPWHSSFASIYRERFKPFDRSNTDDMDYLKRYAMLRAVLREG